MMESTTEVQIGRDGIGAALLLSSC